MSPRYPGWGGEPAQGRGGGGRGAYLISSTKKNGKSAPPAAHMYKMKILVELYMANAALV